MAKTQVIEANAAISYGNSIAAHLPIINSHFIEKHYAQNTIRLHLSAIKTFGIWLQDTDAPLCDVNEDTIVRYIEIGRLLAAPLERPLALYRTASMC